MTADIHTITVDGVQRRSIFRQVEIIEMRNKYPDYREPCRVCGERVKCWCIACEPPKDDNDLSQWECHACRLERRGEHHHKFNRCTCGARRGEDVA